MNNIINNSDYVIYFKPEETMTVGGVKYDENGAYALPPHKTWDHPIDGVKTHLNPNQVFKVPGKMQIPGKVIIDTKGEVDLFFYGLSSFADSGWKSSSPGTNWNNLWNSKPYKPKKR